MYKSAYESREDLKEFGDNGLLLFSLILRFGYDDITTIASEALTDGPNDKKADLVLINKDDGIAIIAQGYYATIPKQSAPSSKASDLNTAVGWLLNREINDLPEHLQSPALELRTAIADGSIHSIEAWYVHNLPESQNCENELKTVEHTLSSIVSTLYPDLKITVSSHEIGDGKLSSMYQMTQTPILVNEKLEFKVPGGFEIKGDDWHALSTAVPIRTLHEMFGKYGKDIFSANIRDYLGTRKTDSNINYGIKITAKEIPQKFCVYNNGITAITHSYELKDNILHVSGLSIVNGAQTTGAIGTLKDSPSEQAFVSARFIKCDSHDTITNIVRFNNSQNKTTAMDFRSNDMIQDRLRKEFDSIGDHVYPGGRRGGVEDAIKRQSNLLASDSVAQSLAAFHGYPNVAYNQKSGIWNKDELYSKFFNEKLGAEHILLSYSLFETVKELKLSLFAKLKNEEDMLKKEEDRLAFLRMRGANYIFISAISSCLEIILNKKIPNFFRISFDNKIKLNKAKELWFSIVDSTIPFSNHLIEPTKKSLGVVAENEKAIDTFRSLVESTYNANKEIFEKFSENITV
ncbi:MULTISPECIES: AIPR family protein [unclassified Oceanispirochaeta]|uniref:AIPR family protein n=1 Tax=unclassified Oceanispirochaeta TaxID=2635722 RepID=UPI000E08DFB3|nr:MULTISPECIES: AIPR family protein [unclassified Oceanispirochaeta]MBF9019003.1 AIPR family protein [Oceanispirochaeta sp. M2]NPD75504.1 AIPR family protein [Oceanispirochaeta sp. M1]RDG28644.1 hypothetical protein DV872_25765 [Oceanispirochaeta sp. M1]